MLSFYQVPAGSAQRRSMPRPPDARQGDYEAKFDDRTIFYDVFRSGAHVVCLGPPLRNLEQEIAQSPWISALLGNGLTGTIRRRNRLSEIWLRTPDAQVPLHCFGETVPLAVQPNESDRFAGRRVLLIKNRNNETAWITDYMRFHVANHGATAALIYDNGSDAYTPEGLLRQLRESVPDILIDVVPWPYQWGPGGGQHNVWDSDFSQIGILHHARFRWLAKARSVLNLDIDELVVAEDGASVFDRAEASPSGSVHFAGVWVSSARAQALPERRHGQYFYNDSKLERCPNKWCAVPSRCPVEAQWGVHDIAGAGASDPVSQSIRYRHFKGVSTEWKYRRVTEMQPVGDSFTVDRLLLEHMCKAGVAQA